MFDVFYTGPKPNLFAFERPAKSIVHAAEQSRTRFLWFIDGNNDYTNFDFEFRCVPWQSKYVHTWPSQHQPSGGTFFLDKYCAINPAWHFHDTVIPRKRSQDNWYIPQHVDAKSIDFTWHANPIDLPYIYHFASHHQQASGLTYTVSGANEIKFVDAFTVRTIHDQTNWYLPDYILVESIDYTWHPNPLDPPYIYHFQTKWGWDRIGGPEYRVPGASEIKYTDEIIADTKSNNESWFIPPWIDPESIDYTWVPCPADPPYIYEFDVEWGWNNIGGPEYHVPGATERKYVNYFLARTKPDSTNFTVSDHLSDNDAVLRWRPNPTESPYIYIFGNQWYPAELRESARYTVPGAVDMKYVHEVTAKRLPCMDNYRVLYDCEFDHSWEPDPGSPPYVYVFGNQWYTAEVMPTVEYVVPGATEKKYIQEPYATLTELHDNHWHTLIDCKWDYSWVPDPGDPPYIYVFGNQWYSAEVMPTVEYHMPGATERKYMHEPRAMLLENLENWTVPEEIDANSIDFSWVPHPGDEPYIHHFGTDYQQSVGLTYTVPSAKEIKFAGEIPLKHIEKASSLQVLDIFFIDRNNAVSQARFHSLQQRYPHAQKIRYFDNMLDTIKRCLARSKTTKFWVVSSECVYDEFDFAWHAEPWQQSMTHVFGSQWQKWSDTFLINKYEFERCSKWCRGIEEFPNLNFVTDQPVIVPNDLHDIYWIDHGNRHLYSFDQLREKYPNIKGTRLAGSYLDTLKRIANTATTEYVWIISSLCDYTRFDFSWHPEPWQREMIHVFPSGVQRRGDTFYIHVESFKQQMVELELLDWFNVINYCEDQVVERWPFEVVEYRDDDLVAAVKSHNFTSAYAIFMPWCVESFPFVFDPCLWSEKDRKIISATKGGALACVPRDAKSYIQNQLYDYPYIEKLDYDHPTNCDVIFISNGEPDADRWYQHLSDVLGYNPTRIDGVNGRVAAYQAAAHASGTNWFFAVFAKLEVDANFDWTWQPDRMQELKHYIFHARNPVNGLEYGHMGMIAYNRKLVLETEEHGLDFTLSKPHAVVPICSGVAHYNTTPELTWRTAFREVVKLSYDVYTTDSIENNHRLKIWLTQAQGEHADWSIQGAKDAVEYCQLINYDYKELLQTFEWDWLQQYWQSKYSV